MTKLEEYLEGWFSGETTEVGIYLAIAQRADEEGYPEVALALRQVANEEAQHAALVAEKLGKVKSTKDNLAMLVEGELNAQAKRLEAAQLARQAGDGYFAALMEKAAYDEGRHAAMFRALQKRFLKTPGLEASA
ncbi:MAG: rubrerythrin family protein [Chloroflexi bacterium]|nr:rubrerythrin family protein [Chloroflexota bacterium]